MAEFSLFGASGAGGTLGDIVSKAGTVIIWVIGIIIFFAVIISIGVFYKRKKMYNIPVTIWTPRSDGKIVDERPALGGYFKIRTNQGSGSVTTFRLKRKGLSTVEIVPPASRFLVGLNRHLYLIQKGMEDFEPVLPDSFRFVTTAKGRKINVVDLKCINQDATAWVEDMRENSKKRFTFAGFWEKYKDFIQITIFIFIVMLSLYINWMGLKDVTVELARVADGLKGIPGVR